jgi:serine/threonine protein kinase
MGTPGYLSRNNRAVPVDERTDIWASGAVLYEMLADKPAFFGRDGDSDFGGYLGCRTRLGRFTCITPTTIRELLGWCLERDREQRLRDIGEARIVIHMRAAYSSRAP